ncbi:MAG: branched-chain amino acid ABC transporter permease [Caldiserica bacterium]|jgi:branched-chain amino acid transport system permease protein|nr:branched-chain amino acid ABC transporter permease [Caldisericota bacterium]MDH7562269.1 branched-chain amino acid ABC transporter permease [Caldisericota bacterium]
MRLFLEQFLNGLTIGSFYALVAMGYSMVYGVMKLINFAHGDLFALGSYLGYTVLVIGAGWITQALGVWGGVAVAITGAMIGIGIAGLVVERIAYRPVYKAGRLPLVVSALGMSIFISNGIMAIWGPRFQAYPPEAIPSAVLSFGDIKITLVKLVTLLVSLGLMALIYWMVEKTLFGAAVRATALDRDTATLMGIDFRKIILFVFFVGPALGAMAGVFAGLNYGRIIFNLGWTYGLKAFTATILGGIGNIPGAMIGGLLLGVMESLFEGFVSGAWKSVFVFLVLIAILIVRPTGLIGEKVAEKV